MERQIIQTIGSLLPDPSVLGDDAFIEPGLNRIYTTDMLVEGRHFRRDYFTPEDLGWRAAAVNLSDIAASGGRPLYLLVSLGLPQEINLAWVTAFYQGMQALCRQTGGAIVGGDTVGSDRLVVNVTAIGEVPVGHAPGRRNQAQPGDWIVTTGFSGLSAVGLKAFQQGLTGYPQGQQAHLRPWPRIVEGLQLSAQYKRYALMDTSDGLADALLKIAEASGVRLVVDAAAIPLHPEVTAFAPTDPLSVALYGGEDFQLLATVPEPPPTESPFTVIGRVEAGPPGSLLRHPQGREVALSFQHTYQHFEGPG